MKTPSTRTLVLLAIGFFLATSLLMPPWYHPPVPVTGPDGSVLRGPDGKVLLHREMTEFNQAMIRAGIYFVCFLSCAGWLIIRFFYFLYARWRCGKADPVDKA